MAFPETTDPATVAALANRRLARASQALMGICAGITADGDLNDFEIQFLSTWLAENNEVASHWPGSEIARQIRDALADGFIADNERQNLLKVLQHLTGTEFTHTGAAAPGPALPVDDDPSIFFRHMSFCFTGQFVYGTRAACERAVLKLGAVAVDTISKKLNYLVIGSLASSDWFNSSYGRKIEKAVSYREQGAEIVIASERQWTAAIADALRTPAA